MHTSHTSKQNLSEDENGLVAIIVTAVLMVLMTLVVLAMSQNVNREQRQTIDRQLSDQAFYNAESGINDVANYLYKTPSAPIDNENKCEVPGMLPADGFSKAIDGTNGNNRYTCISYDKAPTNLLLKDLQTSQPKVLPLIGTNGITQQDITQIQITWEDTVNASAPDCNFSDPSPLLPEQCSYAGLRVELVSPRNNRESLRASMMQAFLLPSVSGSGTINYATGNDGQGMFGLANCDNTIAAGDYRCSMTISGITQPGNLYLNIRSLYRSANVQIKAFNGSTPLRLANAQTVIDSTGRAEDVLRRLQVRIPAEAQYDYPGFALQTRDSICKVLQVAQPTPASGSVESIDLANCPID